MESSSQRNPPISRRSIVRGLFLVAFAIVIGLGDQAVNAAAPVGVVEVDWKAPGNEDVLAPRAGKPILYFFTADWCPLCHQIKRGVFRRPEQIEKIEEWYYPIEVKDVSQERGANLPEVNDALRKYRIESLPTLIVALPDGTEVARQSGFGGAGRVSKWLETQHAEALSRMASRDGLNKSPEVETAPDS